MPKLKVIFLQNYFLHYRIDFYEELSKYFDIIVVHCGTEIETNIRQIICQRKKFLNISFMLGLNKIIYRENPDVIVSMFDLHYPQYIFTRVIREKRTIFWGLDSGRSRYVDIIKKLIINKSKKPVVFYSKTVFEKWEHRLNVPVKIAQNSVLVESRYVKNDFERFKFINVGALSPRKRNDILLKAFRELPDEIQRNASISLVGDGPEREKLERLACELEISEKVRFFGHVEDRNMLSRIYNQAVASVSVGQAGLAVVQSIGFGVPFITRKDAITGGEIYGVVPNKTGYFLSGAKNEEAMIHELTETLCDAWYNRKNKEYYANIRCWYEMFNSIPCMTDPFIKLIRGQI